MSTDYNDLKKIDNDGNPLVGNAGAIAIMQKKIAAQKTGKKEGRT